MKLASLGTTRDGELVVVNRELTRYSKVEGVSTLQDALDQWEQSREVLQYFSNEVNKPTGGIPFNAKECRAPLPRAYQWIDGSAYLSHMYRIRKSRGAEMPKSFEVDPLVYQGGSDDFLGACDDAVFGDSAWGIDLEAEVAVVVSDVPMGTTAEQVIRYGYIKLVMLANDWSLRHLIADEVSKGFGFFQGKPSTSFSPVAVTPDELGLAWNGRCFSGRLQVEINDQPIGTLGAGIDLQFDFPRLIEHCAKSRNLRAGTIIGSGTVSNHDPAAGVGCIAEMRALEKLSGQVDLTNFLKHGDRVAIDCLNDAGSIFGRIDQTVRIRHKFSET